jgi:CRISPR/Cas system-associated protein Csm6
VRTVSLTQALSNNGYQIVLEKDANSEMVRVFLRRSYYSRRKGEHVVVLKKLGEMYKGGLLNLASEIVATVNFS